MNSDEIRRKIETSDRLVDRSRDRRLGISSHYLRFVVDGRPCFAVGSERTSGDRINALVNAVHWCRKAHPGATDLNVVWGSEADPKDDAVLDAIATLLANRSGSPAVEAQVNFTAWGRPAPDLSREGACWADALSPDRRLTMPPLLADLEAAVGNPSFRWYRSVTNSRWSGRVEGLEVCTSDGRSHLHLEVGRAGRDGHTSRARDGFLELLAERSRKLDLPRDSQIAADLLRELAISRREGKLAAVQMEHHLESRILRGDVTIDINGVGRLEPLTLEAPFQFPTCWTRGGDARYVDVLMRQGSTPWVIELKIDSGGQASYYRGGVSQAVLYRQFIRNAGPFQQWFKNHGLKEHDCRAAVVVPDLQGPCSEQLLDDLQVSARDFGIEVVCLALQ